MGGKPFIGFGVQVTMSDEDIIRMFYEVAGFGSISQPPKAQLHHKQLWRWLGTGTKAETFGWLLLPHLGERRRGRFGEVLVEVRN